MKMNRGEFRDKVLGCWMGKNAGGTLGAPMEWYRGVNDVTFYQQDLDGNPLPNDDLDIQLLWLIALEEKGINLNGRTLGDYWLNYITPYWAEYGAAKVNMKSGLQPPFSGMVDNVFKDSCGCFIRSEIWACIAPGCPDLAVKYAYEDGIIDHGDGEGVYAEMFCAAVESAAFVESDLRVLIDIGLSYIPDSCAVAGAIRLAIKLYDDGKTLFDSRDEIIRQYNGGYNHGVSPEDVEKGFIGGKIGFDVPDNMGILILGLLHGEGDFGKSLCYTVNCGEDTDCTAATVGAILGIISGYNEIPDEWKTPIGDGIITACLNLGDLGSYGGKVPRDIHNLTDRTIAITNQVLEQKKINFQLTDSNTDISAYKTESFLQGDNGRYILENWGSGVYEFDFINAVVSYPDGVHIKAGEKKQVTVKVQNRYHMPERIRVKVYAAGSITASPAKESAYLIHDRNSGKVEFSFDFTADENLCENIVRCVLEITMDGRATVCHVPIVFIG